MQNSKLQIKTKNFFLRFWPILFILGVWGVFSAPYIFQNKVPYASTYQVNQFSPWNQYQEFAGPVKNGSLPDVTTQIIPWKYFTINSLKQGQIPFWNPYSMGGTPHLANYQSAVFSPFNLVFLVLPFIDAWSVVVLLQPLLAGLFMYLFLRALKVSDNGSALGSIAYMFCGFIVVWMPYGTLSMAVAFLPLIFLSVEKSFLSTRGKGSIAWPLLLSLSLATSFFSGHIQMSVYIALYTWCYMLFKFAMTRNWRNFLRVFAFYGLGLLLSLVQIIPTLELYKVSIRSELFSTAGAIPLQYLVTVIAPDFFGNPVTRNDWMSYYPEWAGFIGVVPFFLTISALFLGKQKKPILFFFLAGLIIILLAVDSPVQSLLKALHLPVFSTSIPSRIIALFSFSFIVLAGFGFDALISSLRTKNKKLLSGPFIIVSLLVTGIWLSLLVFSILPPDKMQIAVRNFMIPSFLFSVILAVSLLIIFLKRKILIVLLVWLLLMFTLVDSLRFASKWVAFDPRELVFPMMPVIEAMQKNIGHGRVYGDFGAWIDTYYALPSIDGYDPLYNKRYGEFIQSASAGQWVNAQRSVVGLDKNGKYTDRALDIMGTTLIYHPRANTNQTWSYPVWKKKETHTQIYKDAKFEVFKNTTALPRAKMFYDYEVLTGDTKLIQRLYSDKFDYRNVVLLEEETELPKNKDVRSKNKVEIETYTPNKVVISVVTDEPGLLFLSDTHYPKWKVTVNGKQEKIYRADYAFRAVKVPAGESIVEFYYSGLF